jgi:hypothetical protein
VLSDICLFIHLFEGSLHSKTTNSVYNLEFEVLIALMQGTLISGMRRCGNSRIIPDVSKASRAVICWVKQSQVLDLSNFDHAVHLS